MEAITAIPQDERDYDLTTRLARALNNMGSYQKAMEQLLSVAEEGENDPLWHFRLGYSCFYLRREEEAEAQFRRTLELDPGDKDAEALLGWCRRPAPKAKEKINTKKTPCPVVYTAEELDVLGAFLQERFGEWDSVFHELAFPDIHVDIAIIPPAADREWYTLATMGMGARWMRVPAALADKGVDRAELVVCLPPDWRLGEREERWYWPLR